MGRKDRSNTSVNMSLDSVFMVVVLYDSLVEGPRLVDRRRTMD